jgi:hypothetical protein
VHSNQARDRFAGHRVISGVLRCEMIGLHQRIERKLRLTRYKLGTGDVDVVVAGAFNVGVHQEFSRSP